MIYDKFSNLIHYLIYIKTRDIYVINISTYKFIFI